MLRRDYYYETSGEDEDDSSSSSDDEDEDDSSSSSDDDENDNCYTDTHKRGRKFEPRAQKKHKKSMYPAVNQGRMPQHNNNQQAGVYALRNAQTNVCYVGKSTNIDNRVLQHRSENSPDVLSRESVLTQGSENDLESWERNEVLTRMYREGMESVRGWKYTRRGRLTMDEKVSARNDIMEKFDLCRRCGRNSHFADKCFARTSAVWCEDIPMQ